MMKTITAESGFTGGGWKVKDKNACFCSFYLGFFHRHMLTLMSVDNLGSFKHFNLIVF